MRVRQVTGDPISEELNPCLAEVESILIARQVVKKFLQKNRNLYVLFTNLVKAFDTKDSKGPQRTLMIWSRRLMVGSCAIFL